MRTPGNDGQNNRPRPLDNIGVPGWPAYGAALWALLFAAISFYWAFGGTALLDTIGEAVTDPALSGDPAVVAAVWLSAFVKLAGVPGALALAQRWGTFFPRWLVLLAGWGVTALLCLYGGASLVQQLLMVAGVVDVSDTFRPVLLWHLFLWTPVWLVGGVLYGFATFYFARATRATDTATR